MLSVHSPIPEHSREEAGETLQLPTLIPEVGKGNNAGWDSPVTPCHGRGNSITVTKKQNLELYKELVFS